MNSRRRISSPKLSSQHCIRPNEYFDRAETGASKPLRGAQPMSVQGQKPALPRRSIDVRFALNKQTLTERVQCDAMCQNLTHALQQTTCTVAMIYSITSSARASNIGGTVMPSALAVLRLITSSYFVACCTGRSAGFSPLRMRST